MQAAPPLAAPAAATPSNDAVATAPEALETGSGPLQWFIYYRVAAADLAQARTLVAQFQQQIALEFPGLACGLLRRPAKVDGQVTLMETYQPPAGGEPGAATPAQALLQARLAQGPADLAGCLQSGRHVETFVPCA